PVQEFVAAGAVRTVFTRIRLAEAPVVDPVDAWRSIEDELELEIRVALRKGLLCLGRQGQRDGLIRSGRQGRNRNGTQLMPEAVRARGRDDAQLTPTSVLAGEEIEGEGVADEARCRQLGCAELGVVAGGDVETSGALGADARRRVGSPKRAPARGAVEAESV